LIVVSDIETNRLVDPDKIWCIVCKEYPSGTIHTFRYPDLSGFKEFVSKVTTWVFHNGIDFDVRQISRIITIDIPPSDVCDTLILSRLLNYSLEGGHSLDAWGLRLGYPKKPIEDFSTFSEELIERCTGDVEITYKLFSKFKKYLDSPEWQPSIQLEHQAAILALEMSANGFPFDHQGADNLAKQFKDKLDILDKEILDAFPPKCTLVREINPSLTKHGTLHRKDFKWLPCTDGCLDLSPYSADSPFSLVTWEPFNPGSVRQIVDRMNAAGWQPTEKTKKHLQVERALRQCRDKAKRKSLQDELTELQTWGWKVSEQNLLTVPDTAPQATRKLQERLILARRLSTLEEWLNAYNPATKCVHGRFNTIGCWTHRFSHVEPNFANIIANDKPYGPEMRGLWRVEDDEYLIDVDADGIQLRVLAHYIDDPVFTEALVNGRKEDRTDMHSVNQRALGAVCKTREMAKTFIYSWLLGAGAGMTAKVLGCSLSEANAARTNFENFYPGLKSLRRKQIPLDASRGYFLGLDGRKVICDSEHHMLSGYLQNGEAVIMKTAWCIAKENLPDGVRFINFVHDEFVLAAKTEELANEALTICSDAIRQAGEVLKLKCPMKGNGSIGETWAQVH
jgi:DNA polymerase I